MSAPPLHLHDATVRIGRATLLDGVHLTLQPGELVVLIGPNGAGKSTLLRVLAGQIRTRQGEARFGDRPINTYAARTLAQSIAWRSQHVDAPFGLTALHTVLLGRMPWHAPLAPPSASDRAIAQAALDELGVGHLAERSILHLSGGERQRVHVASALAQTPRYLLLDEPTSAQDFDGASRIACAIQRRVRDGHAALVCLHDVHLAARIAHRVVLLHRGRVLAEGPPWDVILSDRFEEAFGTRVQRAPPSDTHPGWVGPLLADDAPSADGAV
jgi:ABC-type cobalamin/Fe3+-siderophores transport system ATPase subunit